MKWAASPPADRNAIQRAIPNERVIRTLFKGVMKGKKMKKRKREMEIEESK